MTSQEDPGVSQMGPDLAMQLLPSSWEMWRRGDEVAAEEEAVWLWIWSVLYLNPKTKPTNTHTHTHTHMHTYIYW